MITGQFSVYLSLVAAGAIPSGLPMSAGDRVRVQVNVDFIAGSVYIGLCGQASCSSVQVTGYKKGVMGFSTWIIHINSIGPLAHSDSEVVTEVRKDLRRNALQLRENGLHCQAQD